MPRELRFETNEGVCLPGAIDDRNSSFRNAFVLNPATVGKVMDDLFQSSPAENVPDARMNLAARIRPRTLEEVAGQQHLLAPGKLLRRLIDSDLLTAAIFYGPPGTGKTTVARLIASKTASAFEELSGVESSIAHLRQAVEKADQLWRTQQRRTVLLLDEIHRFNKSQQDAMLPHVERGAVRLVGATTENPFFYVNSALVSRTHIFEFKHLEAADVMTVLQRALSDVEHGLGSYQVEADEDALKFLSEICDGDCRKALGALELAVLTTPSGEDGKIPLTLQVAEHSIQKKAIAYDHDGDSHYDTISAFIKSVRGSEPDTALYWLAKMLLAGEDPRFIARRLVILASEDIGMADPQALGIAVACHEAVAFIGMPEGRIPLAETTVYLATAPKSNAAYMGISAAMEEIESGRLREVPAPVRDTHYSGAKKLGCGEGYQYAHDYEEGIATNLTVENLPNFYKPTMRGYEKIVSERLERWREIRKQREKNK